MICIYDPVEQLYFSNTSDDEKSHLYWSDTKMYVSEFESEESARCFIQNLCADKDIEREFRHATIINI